MTDEPIKPSNPPLEEITDLADAPAMSIPILFVGDQHLADKPPRYCTDAYLEDLWKVLEELIPATLEELKFSKDNEDRFPEHDEILDAHGSRKG